MRSKDQGRTQKRYSRESSKSRKKKRNNKITLTRGTKKKTTGIFLNAIFVVSNRKKDYVASRALNVTLQNLKSRINSDTQIIKRAATASSACLSVLPVLVVYCLLVQLWLGWYLLWKGVYELKEAITSKIGLQGGKKTCATIRGLEFFENFVPRG